jgi:hypothetical protein
LLATVTAFDGLWLAGCEQGGCRGQNQEEKKADDGEGSRFAPAKMAAVGGQPASRHGGLHRDDNASPYLSASGPGGPGSGLVLSRLGILGEPQPRPRRHERQLCRRGRNGSVFYRDVPPGHYHIAPQSYGRDINQDKDVDVAPGNSCIARSYHHAVGNWAWAAPNPASIATPVVRRSTMTRGEEMGFEPPVPDIAWMARVRWRC